MPDPDISGLRFEAPPGAPGADVPSPRRRWRTRVLLPLAVLAAFAAVLAVAAGDALRPAVPVRVVPVVVRAGGAAAGGSVSATAAGWIEPDPFPQYAAALADGVIAEVLVLDGQPVEKDQVVARLVPEDARLALAAAEAELGARRAEQEAAQREWDRPVERERAVAAARAARDRARAGVEAAAKEGAAQEARVEETEDTLRREEGALEARAVPEATVVRSRLRARTERATLEADRSRRELAAAEEAAAAAELAAAEEGLRLRIPERLAVDRAAADVARAAAARDEAALRVARLEVRCPAAGVAMRALKAPGDKVMQGMDDPRSSQVLAVYDPKRLQVRVDVPLVDAARVGVGHGARVSVESLPDRVFEGTVTRIVHQADIQKNTLQVKVAVKDPAPEMKPEMLAKVQFLAPGEAGGAAGGGAERVFAPARLLQASGPDRARAWVVEKGREPRASLREVRLGAGRADGWVEVAEGLRPGDLLVDGDVSGLSEGRRVRVTGESHDHEGR